MNQSTKDEFKTIKDNLNQVSRSFCLAKWLHATVLLQNGLTQSCHHVRAHKVNLKSLQKNPSCLHNTPEKKQARAWMLFGLRPKECSFCWELEKKNLLSDRSIKSSSDWAKPFFEEVLSSGIRKDISPRYLEISFSNQCPCNCLYCSPISSSSWYQDVFENGPYATQKGYRALDVLGKNGELPLGNEVSNPYLKAFWRWWPVILDHLIYFRITGGEPLLDENFWLAMDHLVVERRPLLNLEVNSALSCHENLTLRLVDTINRLEHCVHSFSLHVSLDTFGVQAEYIRHGISFDRVIKNIELILKNSSWPIKLVFMNTVNALSISGLCDLLRLIKLQRETFPHHQIWIDFPHLREPDFLSVRILTNEFKKYFQDNISYLVEHGFRKIEQEKMKRIFYWVYDADQNGPVKERELDRKRRDFHLFIREFDRRMGTDFLAVFPEFSQFWSMTEHLIDKEGLV